MGAPVDTLERILDAAEFARVIVGAVRGKSKKKMPEIAPIPKGRLLRRGSAAELYKLEDGDFAAVQVINIGNLHKKRGNFAGLVTARRIWLGYDPCIPRFLAPNAYAISETRDALELYYRERGVTISEALKNNPDPASVRLAIEDSLRLFMAFHEAGYTLRDAISPGNVLTTREGLYLSDGETIALESLEFFIRRHIESLGSIPTEHVGDYVALFTHPTTLERESYATLGGDGQENDIRRAGIFLAQLAFGQCTSESGVVRERLRFLSISHEETNDYLSAPGLDALVKSAIHGRYDSMRALYEDVSLRLQRAA